MSRARVTPTYWQKVNEDTGADLVVAMDERLVGLPWELLHDGKGFFCRRYRMGRVVSTPPSSRKKEKRKLASPVSLLSVADPEGNLPAALDGAQIAAHGANVLVNGR